MLENCIENKNKRGFSGLSDVHCTPFDVLTRLELAYLTLSKWGLACYPYIKTHGKSK